MLYVNPFSVIFFPSIDRGNNYSTIVFDWMSGNILKINEFGYWILKEIDDSSGISHQKILEKLSREKRYEDKKKQILNFVEKMKSHKIIVER